MWLWQELGERYPHAGGADPAGRCGEQLAGVLIGKLDPLGLLFPRDGVRAEDLYHDATGPRVFNRLVRQSVEQAVSTLPSDRHLRVLEIGAGTGGTTGSVLPVLPAERTEYHYTDLSAGFFDARRHGSPIIRCQVYRVLDIERNPGEQGFGRHQYDLVLAANVLHATRNIEETVVHVRQLLAPGGLLVSLGKGLDRLAWLDLTFGLLEGWWRFKDWPPRLHPAEPGAVVRSAAIPGIRRAGGGAGPSGLTQHAVILARGPAEVELTQQPAGSWLILADRQGLGAGLAQGVSRQGHSCVLVEPAKRYECGLRPVQAPGTGPGGWATAAGRGGSGRAAPGRGGAPVEPGLVPTDATTPATLARDLHDGCGHSL